MHDPAMDVSRLPDTRDDGDARIKRLITECMMQVNGQTLTMINVLEKNIIRLQKEVVELRNEDTHTNSSQSTQEDATNIPTQNNFLPLQTHVEVTDYIYDDDARGLLTNNHPAKTNKIALGIDATHVPKRRPQVVVSEHPENNQHFRKTMPGNSNYADITRNGKETCIIGASLIKRINMREFNAHMNDGFAIKRSFPGARAAQLFYYIDEVLNLQNIDRIIINIGMNDITSQDQSEREILKEIIDLVLKCHNHGVNDIFVSGLTYNPHHQPQIKALNELLKNSAASFNFTFIDNPDIEERHLWKDKLHLNTQGTISLARNFLHFLNRDSFYDGFY